VGLALTPVADSLGLLGTAKNAWKVVADFGVVQTKVGYALGVPMPETHALMGRLGPHGPCRSQKQAASSLKGCAHCRRVASPPKEVRETSSRAEGVDAI